MCEYVKKLRSSIKDAQLDTDNEYNENKMEDENTNTKSADDVEVILPAERNNQNWANYQNRLIRTPTEGKWTHNETKWVI